MSHVLSIAGNPGASPKSSGILEYSHQFLRRKGLTTHAISIRCLPAEPLLRGDSHHPEIQDAIARVAQAEGVIVVTPVSKGSYTGILKAFLDILPCNALRDKVVLPIVTSCTAGQLLVLEYALKPVLSALGARNILDGVYLTDYQMQFAHGGKLQLEDSAEEALDQALQQLTAEVRRLSAQSSTADWVI